MFWNIESFFETARHNYEAEEVEEVGVVTGVVEAEVLPETRCPRLLVNIQRFVRLFFRVWTPSAGFPHGVDGCRPMETCPSHPPCGWSTGFITIPRLCGRRPFHRVRPAFPTLIWL